MKKLLIIITINTLMTFIGFSQVPAHTFTTGTDIPKDGNWTNTSAVFDTTNAYFLTYDMFSYVASVPGAGAPQEILWGINQGQGAYLRIFMPPGIGQINMGVNAYALAGSQCIKTAVIGEYDINATPPTGATGTETWQWGCGSFSKAITRTYDITQEAYLMYGFYNEDNLYSGGFSPNDLSFTFVVTDSVEFWTWARGIQNTAPTCTLITPTDNQIFTQGDVVTVSANVTDDLGLDSVVFYIDGAPLATFTAAPYSYDIQTDVNTPTGDYTFYAIAYDNGGLQTQSNTVTATLNAAGTSNVSENDFNGLKIFPNPVVDQFTLSTTENIAGLELYDLNGKVVFKETNLTSNTINVSYLPQGIYFLKINFNDSIKTIKLVKT